MWFVLGTHIPFCAKTAGVDSTTVKCLNPTGWRDTARSGDAHVFEGGIHESLMPHHAVLENCDAGQRIIES